MRGAQQVGNTFQNLRLATTFPVKDTHYGLMPKTFAD